MIDDKGVCRDCGNYVGVNFLACSLCVQRKSDEHMAIYQRHYLREVAEGNVELRIARLRNHEQHVQLFGYDDRSFCGLDLTGRAVERRYRLPYSGDNMRDLCAECRELVDRGVKAAYE
jgi:hypothetical protein